MPLVQIIKKKGLSCHLIFRVVLVTPKRVVLRHAQNVHTSVYQHAYIRVRHYTHTIPFMCFCTHAHTSEHLHARATRTKRVRAHRSEPLHDAPRICMGACKVSPTRTRHGYLGYVHIQVSPTCTRRGYIVSACS